MKKLILFILCALSDNLFSVQTARIIPIASNQDGSRISILLRLYFGQWTDFGTQTDDTNVATMLRQAIKAFNDQTRNAFNLEVPSNPILAWQEGDDSRIFLVPVQFIKGSILYTHHRNPDASDFRWIPIESMVDKSALQEPSNRINYPVNSIILRQMNGLFSLATEAQSISATVAPSMEPVISSASLSPSTPTTTTRYWGSRNDRLSNHLYFYEKTDPNTYFLTNFYDRKINLDGKDWNSTEHYYQAQKFPHLPAIQKEIANAPTPAQARLIAGKNHPQIDPSFFGRMKNVMEKAVKAKFSQHDDLKVQLLATGNQILVEDAGARDANWGNGPDGKGKNMLGQILMKIRDELLSASGELPAVQKSLIDLLTKLKNQLDQLKTSLRA